MHICIYIYVYIYVCYPCPPMRLHFPIFTGRYLQKTDFLGQEEKRQTLSNFRDLTFPISSFPILLDVTFQLPGFPTFQHSNFPTFQHSNFPTFQHSNFPTFQLSNIPTFRLSNFFGPNFPTFQHSKVRPKKLESWKVGMLECRKVGKLERWKDGMLESWKVRKLECWKVRSKKMESRKVRPNKVGKLESEAQKHWTKAGKSAHKT